jgi:uncharacterized membrane protein
MKTPVGMWYSRAHFSWVGDRTMATTAPVRVAKPRSNTKLWMFLAFAFLTVFVVYGKNQGITNPSSDVAQHFAPAKAVLIPHAIFATVALIVGAFQFSNRLRARYRNVHRTMGYVYVVCVTIGGPTGILVAMRIGPPELIMASVVQSLGWLLTTAIALYCIRSGNVAQHRRWMIRSYPFGMVFSVARLFVPVALKFYGQPGFIQTVWTTIALAALLPSVLIEWNEIVKTSKVRKTSAA